MISKELERVKVEELNAENGNGLLVLDKLLKGPNAPQKLRTFAKATLEAGASVGYHVHTGESESYYILSGVAEYNDDGNLYEIHEGTVTYTPSGHGHGIKNIGKEPLVFIALIILD